MEKRIYYQFKNRVATTSCLCNTSREFELKLLFVISLPISAKNNVYKRKDKHINKQDFLLEKVRDKRRSIMEHYMRLKNAQ
jgi:hypothetical protein